MTGKVVSLRSEPAIPTSECPDFVEKVAAGIVLDEGRQFFPLDPAKAETPIAIPWALASELVHVLPPTTTLAEATDVLSRVAIIG